MLAGDQPAQPITGVAVAPIRWPAIDANRAGLLFPFQNSLIGNVGPQQIPAIGKIYRPLGPTASGIQPLHRGAENAVFFEPGIKNFNGRVGITRVVAPTG